MPKLPNLSGGEVVSVFHRFGWAIARQRGSHIIMAKKDEIITLSIPNHKEVAKGTLRSLIRTANITINDFLATL